MAGKDVSKVAVGSKQASLNERVKEKTYAVVVKAKDEFVKMTSDEVKEKVMKNVSGELNIRVRAVRNKRDGDLAIEVASEVRMLRECKKFGGGPQRRLIPRSSCSM